MSLIFFLECALFTASVSLAGCNVSPAPANAMPQSALTGSKFKASLAAYFSFLPELEKRRSQNDQGEFFSKIENYDLSIREDEKSYSIIFLPKNPPGRHGKGGDATIVVSKDDYAVISRTLGK